MWRTYNGRYLNKGAKFSLGAQGSCKVDKNHKMSSFKSNENIHKKGDGSYYVVSANKAS